MTLCPFISKKKGVSQYLNPTLYHRNDATPLHIKGMVLRHFISKKKEVFYSILTPLYIKKLMLCHFILKKKGISQYLTPLYIKEMMLHHFIVM